MVTAAAARPTTTVARHTDLRPAVVDEVEVAVVWVVADIGRSLSYGGARAPLTSSSNENARIDNQQEETLATSAQLHSGAGCGWRLAAAADTSTNNGRGAPSAFLLMVALC